jgi:hypothetical protein
MVLSDLISDCILEGLKRNLILGEKSNAGNNNLTNVTSSSIRALGNNGVHITKLGHTHIQLGAISTLLAFMFDFEAILLLKSLYEAYGKRPRASTYFQSTYSSKITLKANSDF